MTISTRDRLVFRLERFSQRYIRVLNHPGCLLRSVRIAGWQRRIHHLQGLLNQGNQA